LKYVGGDINTAKEFFMNKKRLILLVMLVLLLTFVAVMAFSQSSSNVRWEFKFVGYREATVENFSSLYSQGWEIVGSGRNTSNDESWLLKRRLP
jgi:hypothetical protein